MNYDVTRKVQEALADLMREALPDIPIWTDEPMSTERDTHFRRAVDFLLQEMSQRRFIDDDTSLHYEEMQVLVAQFTYDLVVHTMDCAYAELPEYILPDASHVPDLAAWPEPPTTAE